MSLPAEENLRETEKEPAPVRRSAGPPENFSDYAVIFKSRDIFESPYEKEVATPTPQPEESGAANAGADFTEDFKLVGIVIDEHPKAIVEDTQKQETVFLSLGDRLGDAVLKDIRADRVIFLYQGKDIELVP